MNILEMKKTAAEVSELMKVLSNEKRLMILCQLVTGEKSVGELAELLQLQQAAVSQQLALLRKDNLVATERDGQTIYYRLEREDVRSLMHFLYENFCD